jgi:hypothetical protein
VIQAQQDLKVRSVPQVQQVQQELKALLPAQQDLKDQKDRLDQQVLKESREPVSPFSGLTPTLRHLRQSSPLVTPEMATLLVEIFTSGMK